MNSTGSRAVGRRHFLLLGVVVVWGSDSSAGDAGCRRHDLGAFTICVPAAWELVQGGTDSAAGRLTGDGIQLRYDFGLNSDPLRVPPGASDVQEGAATVDGRPARRVGYSVPRGAGGLMHYLGVHVPDAGRSSMGRLKLTVLAYAQDPRRFAAVDTALATIAFKPAPLR